MLSLKLCVAIVSTPGLMDLLVGIAEEIRISTVSEYGITETDVLPVWLCLSNGRPLPRPPPPRPPLPPLPPPRPPSRLPSTGRKLRSGKKEG